MAKTEPKKYQKIEEAEIDLVVQSKDSHEFYERYMVVFPDKKKGIDSISKIWKRRSEFIKKRQEAAAIPQPRPGSCNGSRTNHGFPGPRQAHRCAERAHR